MTGRSKAAVFVLLAIGLAWLIWILQPDDPNRSSEQEPETAVEDNNGPGQQDPSPTGSTDVQGADIVKDATSTNEESSTAPIERIEVVGKLRLTGPDGKHVGGTVELVKVDETFQTYFSTMARIGESIYFDSIAQKQEVDGADGLMEVTADGNLADFVIVIAPGFTPFLDAWQPIPPNEERVIELSAAKPIEVTVLTSDGAPIKDAQVWYRWTGVFSLNESAPLLDRFRERFFQGVEATDEQGKVTLTSTFPEWSTELFIRPGDLWATVVETVEAGKPIEIRCPEAFMATGFVTVNGKAPTQEVQLKATVHQGDQYWMMESGRAKEEGKYKISGIPSGYPAYEIEAIGEGLANQTQAIFAPKPGEIINLDFKMVEGVGGSLTFVDPWGSPIPDARVKFVSEGDRSHMYGYNSNANGLVELPKSFSENDSWWLNLRLGDNLYLRLDQEFQGGDQLKITVPNLARITALEIPPEILGEASIQEVLWSGHSSQSWGTEAWTPETATSTMLASGSANLKITLTDGRLLNQPVVLEPGFDGPVVIDRLPTTLSFELPIDPPASVTIVTQTGITVYDQNNLSGQVSIPLLQGQYSLLAIWPQAAREIPLINLTEPDVDLGIIDAAAAGHVDGIVVNADGLPVTWASLYLASASGYSTQFVETSSDGLFSFYDIAPGSYYLLCDTADSHGSNSATWIEEIRITPQFLVQRVTVQLPTGEENQVRLTCGSDWRFNSFAIVATPLASSHAAVRSQGPTILTAQERDGWIGAAQILDGQVTAQAIPIPSGDGDYTLPSTAMHSSRIQFVNELGEPWKHLLLRIMLNGQPLTRRPTLDSAGAMNFQANADAPWSLQVSAPSGQIVSFDLASLKPNETLVIPKNVQGQVITVRNEEGNPIPWPVIQSAIEATVIPSNQNGQAIIPSDVPRPLVVSADGYLPCVVSKLLGDSITLPLRLDGIQLQAPAGTTRLSWTSDSPYVSLWRDVIKGIGDPKSIALPPMQPGKFRFSAYGDDGALLAEREFILRESGAVLVWKD